MLCCDCSDRTKSAETHRLFKKYAIDLFSWLDSLSFAFPLVEPIFPWILPLKPWRFQPSKICKIHVPGSPLREWPTINLSIFKHNQPDKACYEISFQALQVPNKDLSGFVASIDHHAKLRSYSVSAYFDGVTTMHSEAVYNIHGTTLDKRREDSWIKAWERNTNCWRSVCCIDTPNVHTPNAQLFGGHVCKFHELPSNWYIIPICAQHNSKLFDLPNHMITGPAVVAMKITSINLNYYSIDGDKITVQSSLSKTHDDFVEECFQQSLTFLEVIMGISKL